MTKKKAIQLNVVDLGGGTAKGCDCEAPDLSAYAKKIELPERLSQLENDRYFLTFDNAQFFSGNIQLSSDPSELSGTLDENAQMYLAHKCLSPDWIYNNDKCFFDSLIVNGSPIYNGAFGYTSGGIGYFTCYFDTKELHEVDGELKVYFFHYVIADNSPDIGKWTREVKAVYSVPTKVSELENDADFVAKSALGTAAYENVEDLQSSVLHFQKSHSFSNWYAENSGKTKTIEVDLSSYSKSLLKIGLSLHTDFVDDERSVHIINANGVLLGSISGLTDTTPSASSYPYEVFATCEKIADDIYKIEIAGLGQHITTFSDVPIGYVMGGVYSQTSIAIVAGGIIYGNGTVKIYA